MIAKPAQASMEYKHQQQATRSWTTRRDEKKRQGTAATSGSVALSLKWSYRKGLSPAPSDSSKGREEPEVWPIRLQPGGHHG